MGDGPEVTKRKSRHSLRISPRSLSPIHVKSLWRRRRLLSDANTPLKIIVLQSLSSSKKSELQSEY